MMAIRAKEGLCLGEACRVRVTRMCTWAFLGVAVLVLLTVSRAASVSPVDVTDILAGMRNSDNLLHDYEIQYRTTKKWLCKEIFSQSTATLGKAYPKLLRLEPVSDAEAQKAMTSQYVWRAQGAKFFYTRDFQDEINGLAHSEKHGFDGRRHLQFYDRTGVRTGLVDLPGARYEAMPTDVLRPDDFFARFQGRPLSAWLNEASVTVQPGMETVTDKSCWVIECINKQGPRCKLWITPDCGFRPMKMELHLPNGEYCSSTVMQIREVAEGIWLPMAGDERWYVHPPDSNSLVAYSVAEFEVDQRSVSVNLGLEDRQFTFEFPPGTEVYDRSTGLMYVVGDIEYTAELLAHFAPGSSSAGREAYFEPMLPRAGPSEISQGALAQSDAGSTAPATTTMTRGGENPVWLVAAILVLAGLLAVGAFIVHRRKATIRSVRTQAERS